MSFNTISFVSKRNPDYIAQVSEAIQSLSDTIPADKLQKLFNTNSPISECSYRFTSEKDGVLFKQNNHSAEKQAFIQIPINAPVKLSTNRSHFLIGSWVFSLISRDNGNFQLELHKYKDSTIKTIIELDKTKIYAIGRKPKPLGPEYKLIQLDESDTCVSRSHATLKYIDNEGFVIIDNNSLNHVYLEAGEEEIKVEFEQLISLDLDEFCYFSASE